MIDEGTTVLKGLNSSYLILGKLDQNEISTMYVALEEDYNEIVAIKTIPKRMDKKGEFSRKFRQEARILNELRSDYIPAILDWGDNEEWIFIVMVHTPGKTVQDLIEESEDGFLDERDTLHIILQVAQALVETHANKIVHRDLNPQNILVSRKQEVFIRDFGLAEHIELAQSSGSQVMGTVAYMAPEQADQEKLDIRADLYSLGAIAYEMLTGRAPFEDSNVMQLMLKIAESDPVEISNYRPGLMNETSDFVMRCLEKKPARRFQTPRELIDKLQRIAPGQGESTEGWLYQQAVEAFDKKDYKKTIEICERVIRVDPNYQDVQGMLSRAKRQIVEKSGQRIDRLVVKAKKSLSDNQWDEVKSLCRQVLALDSENKQAKEMLDGLPEIQLISARLLQDDGTEILLGQEYICAGRGDSVDLDLTPWDKNKYCSRNHAELIFQEGNWIVKSHPEAGNPTKVNNKKLIKGKSIKLKDGDLITFADIQFNFKSP